MPQEEAEAKAEMRRPEGIESREAGAREVGRRQSGGGGREAAKVGASEESAERKDIRGGRPEANAKAKTPPHRAIPCEARSEKRPQAGRSAQLRVRTASCMSAAILSAAAHPAHPAHPPAHEPSSLRQSHSPLLHMRRTARNASAAIIRATTTVEGVNSKPSSTMLISFQKRPGRRAAPFRARTAFRTRPAARFSGADPNLPGMPGEPYAALPSASRPPAAAGLFSLNTGMGRNIWNSMPAATKMATTVHTLKPISPVISPPNW